MRTTDKTLPLLLNCCYCRPRRIKMPSSEFRAESIPSEVVLEFSARNELKNVLGSGQLPESFIKYLSNLISRQIYCFVCFFCCFPTSGHQRNSRWTQEENPFEIFILLSLFLSLSYTRQNFHSYKNALGILNESRKYVDKHSVVDFPLIISQVSSSAQLQFLRSKSF